MKEFYLLPKHQFELMNSKKKKIVAGDGDSVNPTTTPCNIKKGEKKKKPEIGERWGTRIIPPPIRKSIAVKGMKYNSKIHPNSNIQQELSSQLQGKNLTRGKLILKHIENSGNIKWDEFGDIYNPLNNYNIIDFIKDITSNDAIADIKIADYKLLVLLGNVPLHYIKNERLKKYILNPLQYSSVKKAKKRKKPSTPPPPPPPPPLSLLPLPLSSSPLPPLPLSPSSSPPPSHSVGSGMKQQRRIMMKNWLSF